MSETANPLPENWLREVVQRHPFAPARQRYSFLLRHLAFLGRREGPSLLLVLLDSVVIFETDEGYEHGMFCPAGSVWYAPFGKKFVRLDPYENEAWPPVWGIGIRPERD